MNIPKQLLNLMGAVLVLAIVAAGALLVAVPVWTDSNRIAAEARTVASSNLTYETQIASLRDRASELPEIQTAVVELRRGIPADPRLDEVFEAAAAAAAATGLTIVSATAGEAVDWTRREPLAPGVVATDDQSAAVTGTDASGSETVPPADGVPAPDSSGAPDSATPSSPKIQIDFTIVLNAPTPEAAESFIDALSSGDRLVDVVHSGLTTTPEGYDLTVNALAFIRTEN